MNIASINDAPSVTDADGVMRPDATDIGKILVNLDNANGRTDRLRDFIFALCDLQRAHDQNACDGNDTAIDAAQTAVDKTFELLFDAQLSLNKS